MIRYYDGHVHYNHKSLENKRAAILKEDYEQGVIKAVNAASTMNSNFFMRKDLSTYVKKGSSLLKHPDFCIIRPKGPQIKFAIGKDPLFVGGDILSGQAFSEEKEFIALADHPDVCAIKTGLNYELGEKNKNYQRHWFSILVHQALAFNLPLNLVIKGAHEEALSMLQKKFECKHYRGVLLDWSEEPALARDFLSMGFLLGIGGKVFTSEDVKHTVKELPLELMMLESDFPRSDRKLPEIAKEVARIKDLPLELVAEITFQNGEKLYG